MSAFCLVDPQSGRIVAADERLATWLTPQDASRSRHIDQLAPGLSARVADLVRAASLSAEVKTDVTGPDGPAQVTLRMTRLTGATELVLVELTDRPASPPENWPTDAVTGLPDRRALASHRARWTSGPACVPHALLFLDLDGFKRVNDEHGHAAGDGVLAELADRWRHCVREGDLVVRYGGDEFVVLLGNVGALTDVQPIVHRLQAAAQQPFQVAGQEIKLSVTTGIALSIDDATLLEALVAAADRDMYTAKARRKA